MKLNLLNKITNVNQNGNVIYMLRLYRYQLPITLILMPKYEFCYNKHNFTKADLAMFREDMGNILNLRLNQER